MGILSGALDIPGWFKSDAQAAQDAIPDYQKRLAGQSEAGITDVNRLAWDGSDPVHHIDGLTDERGNPLSVPGMFAQNIQRGYGAQLDPRNNPFLANAGTQANDAISRSNVAGNIAGGANQQSMAAAGQIGQAGIGARGTADMGTAMQYGQAGQYGQDLGIIRNSAMGNGPSAAAQLAKQQLDASIQAQASQAGQARGGNIAAGMRSAANAGTQIQLQGAQQMAAQRAQEQLNAQGLLNQGNAQLGQNINAMTSQAQNTRAQDIGQAVSGAAATNEAAKSANATYATSSGMGSQGISSLTNLSGQFGQQSATNMQMYNNAQQQYADWLQKEHSLNSGLPIAQFGGYASIAGQSAAQDTQNQGAVLQTLGKAAFA